VARFLDTKELSTRLEEHLARRSDQSHALWAAWVLERWLGAT
jgi:hypothetical protein